MLEQFRAFFAKAWLGRSSVEIPVPEPQSPPKPSPRVWYSKFPTIWEALAVVQDWKCFYCDKEMESYAEARAALSRSQRRKKKSGLHRCIGRATRDHIICLSEQDRRGWHIPIYENAILACGRCNNNRQSTRLSEKQLTKAREINRRALIMFGTETVTNKADQIARMFGHAGSEQDREFRAFRTFPTSKWQYLFQQSSRAFRRCNIPKTFEAELSGAAAD